MLNFGSFIFVRFHLKHFNNVFSRCSKYRFHIKTSLYAFSFACICMYTQVNHMNNMAKHECKSNTNTQRWRDERASKTGTLHASTYIYTNTNRHGLVSTVYLTKPKKSKKREMERRQRNNNNKTGSIHLHLNP